MPRYLISFDDGSMDHVPDEGWPTVAAASRRVVDEARRAGVWIFGGGVRRQRASVVGPEGTVTCGRTSAGGAGPRARSRIAAEPQNARASRLSSMV